MDKKKYKKRITSLLLLLAGNLLVFLTIWRLDRYDRIYIDQVLFQMKSSSEGVQGNLALNATVRIGLFGIATTAVEYWIYKKLFRRGESVNFVRKHTIMFSALSLVIAVIIFITAFDEFDYAKRAIHVHALEYLLKPVSEEELTTNLEEAIWLSQRTEKKKPLLKADLQENHHENIKINAVAENIRNFIAKHYKQDISLQDVAGSMNYSDAYFCKIFKQCFNKSFLVYLTEYRVEKAKILLADMSINIKDVSAEVGYRDSNYFARVFKRSEGITPTEYRLRVLHAAKKGD